MSLRLQLRQLPRERDATRELWPDIATRMEREARAIPRRRPRLTYVLGLAASLMIAVTLVWRWPAPPASTGVGPAVEPMAVWESAAFERAMLLQAGGLVREYEAAIAQFTYMPLPEAVGPSIEVLDRSTREILAALEADPGSVFLLDQLRRTYAKRLHITRQAALG